jgi:hypothetical protein
MPTFDVTTSKITRVVATSFGDAADTVLAYELGTKAKPVAGVSTRGEMVDRVETV